MLELDLAAWYRDLFLAPFRPALPRRRRILARLFAVPGMKAAGPAPTELQGSSDHERPRAAI